MPRRRSNISAAAYENGLNGGLVGGWVDEIEVDASGATGTVRMSNECFRAAMRTACDVSGADVPHWRQGTRLERKFLDGV